MQLPRRGRPRPVPSRPIVPRLRAPIVPAPSRPIVLQAHLRARRFQRSIRFRPRTTTPRRAARFARPTPGTPQARVVPESARTWVRIRPNTFRGRGRDGEFRSCAHLTESGRSPSRTRGRTFDEYSRPARERRRRSRVGRCEPNSARFTGMRHVIGRVRRVQVGSRWLGDGLRISGREPGRGMPRAPRTPITVRRIHVPDSRTTPPGPLSATHQPGSFPQLRRADPPRREPAICRDDDVPLDPARTIKINNFGRRNGDRTDMSNRFGARSPDGLRPVVRARRAARTPTGTGAADFSTPAAGRSATPQWLTAGCAALAPRRSGSGR